LSAIRAATQETAEERSTDEGSPLEEAFDDDDEGIGADSMPQIFLGKKRSRTEFDGRDDSAVQPDATLLSAASGGGTDEAHDPADILGNVAAMFNAEDVDVNGARRRGANGVYSNPRSKANSSRFLFVIFSRSLCRRLWEQCSVLKVHFVLVAKKGIYLLSV
uniref:Uncharacterized protein n=1 Tax=Parascaris equorum TaxID=6256 RepID=A0A914RJ40_PAREQ